MLELLNVLILCSEEVKNEKEVCTLSLVSQPAMQGQHYTVLDSNCTWLAQMPPHDVDNSTAGLEGCFLTINRGPTILSSLRG